MAISYVGAGGTEPTSVGTGTTSFSVPLPTHQEGDVILIPFGTNETWSGELSSDPFPSMTGYYLVAESRVSAVGGCFLKVAGASESNPTIQFPTDFSVKVARAFVYRGVDPNMPIDSPWMANGGTGFSRAAPNQTTIDDGAMALSWAVGPGHTSIGLDTPQSFSLADADNVTTSPNGTLGWAHRSIASAGNVTSPTFGFSHSGNVSVFSLTLRPDDAPYRVHLKNTTMARYSGTVVTCPVPGPEAGDLILVFASQNWDTTWPSPPTGYTQLLQGSPGSINYSRAVFAKISDGTETSVTTTTAVATNAQTAAVFIIGNPKSIGDILTDEVYGASGDVQAAPLTAPGNSLALAFAREGSSFPSATLDENMWGCWFYSISGSARDRSEYLKDRYVSSAGSVTFPTYNSGSWVDTVSILIPEALNPEGALNLDASSALPFADSGAVP